MYISSDFSHFSRETLDRLVGNATEECLYYSKAYNHLTQGKKWVWNWPAFLFGPLWLAYRRLYWEAAVFFMLEELFFKVSTTYLFPHWASRLTAELFFAILWGGLGTPYYLMRNNYRLQHHLPVRSGVSSLIIWGAIFIIFCLSIFI